MAEDYQKTNEIKDGQEQEAVREAAGETDTKEITPEEKAEIDRTRRKTNNRKFLKEIAKTVVMLFLIWLFVYVVTHYLYGFIVVDGDSMNDTMVDDQVGIIQKFNKEGVIQRGDIIVFWSDELDEYLIKRCVAIGGDTISMTEGVLTVNGKNVTEAYIKEPMAWNNEIEEMTLSEDALFAMGDNRNGSLDCRELGPVYMEDVTGKLVVNMGNYGITSKRLVVLVIIIFVVFLILSGVQDVKLKKKLEQIPEEFRDYDVAVTKSTCTGEMTIGFLNPYNHKLELMELVHDDKDIKAYCMKYGQDYKQLMKK